MSRAKEVIGMKIVRNKECIGKEIGMKWVRDEECRGGNVSGKYKKLGEYTVIK